MREKMRSLNKKIYDSVHGFIRFNDLESRLIDSLPFQRLHYIHQLGIAYLVYPGATHTRFEHSLGVMELASRMFDRIAAKFPIPDPDYWRQIVRLAALCHDFGHLPFSHVAEKVLLGKGGHEKWTLRIIQSDHLAPVWETLQSDYPEREVEEDLIKISIGERHLKDFMPKDFTPMENVLSEIITGDFFGSDRMDYLLRDAQCTGVAYGLFDYQQLIEMLCVLPVENKLQLGIEENGIESCESLLLARHFMHKRVYQYPSVKAYAFHLARFMGRHYSKEDLDDLEVYLSLTDSEVLAALNSAARNGDGDAIALTKRHHRFKAIPFGSEVENLSLDIQEEAIAWELPLKKQAVQRLLFPVLKRNGEIVPADRCSEIVIPSAPVGWVYVAPEHESAVEKALHEF